VPSTPPIHRHTPSLTAIDPRGLPVRAVGYWRDNDDVRPQARINRTVHDWAGRAIAQWDPRLFLNASAPANLQTIHALSGAELSTNSVDAGWRVALLGEAGQPIHYWDGRGSQRWMQYDTQLRPESVFEQPLDGKALCTERLSYGASDPAAAERNQCGQLIRHDDPAGSQRFSEFGLHGTALEQTRDFLNDLTLPDWPESIADRELLLEPGEGATTRSQVNALGEASHQTDAKGHRQLFSQTLDGQLREVRLQLNGTPTPKTLVSAITYNAHGQTEREVAGNGVITTLEYDAQNGRLTRLSAQRGNEALQDLSYAYDPVGNVLSIKDAALPIRYFANQRIEPTSHYRYDSFSQLIEATGWEAGGSNKGPQFATFDDPAACANFRQQYSYDPGGNLLELTHEGPQSHGHRLVAAAHSNRCLPVLEGVEPGEDDFRRGFDANGNLLNLQPGQTLSWDLRNQLYEVRPVERVSGLNDRERYVYGADGMRLRKVRETLAHARTLVAETRYLPNLELRNYSGTGEVLQVINVQAGRCSVRVLHWESETPKDAANDQYRYHLNDHLGSCTLELDKDGEVISQERYHPYGTTAWFAGRGEVEASYRTVRYSGKERDATGLYYYGFRYYVAGWQRWLSPDPAGDVDGLNMYRMVGSNPVARIDENGLMMRAIREFTSSSRGRSQEIAVVSTNGRASQDIPGPSSGGRNSQQPPSKNELVVTIIERLVDIVETGRGGMRALLGQQFDQTMIKLSAFYIDMEAGGKLSSGKVILQRSKGFKQPPRDMVNQSREKNDLYSFLTPYVSREVNSENYCLQNVTSDLHKWTEQIVDRQKKRIPESVRNEFLSRMKNAADPEVTNAAFKEDPTSRPPEDQEEALQFIYFMAGQYEDEKEWVGYARDMYADEYPAIMQVSHKRALAVYEKNKALGIYKQS
jgi:insecticidal toxin complex protein TccC